MEVSSADLRRRDAEARQRAQTVFDRPLVLEAGAGTGKTATLVARIVSWCLGPGWDRSAAIIAAEAMVRGSGAQADRVAARVTSRVIAITFTEAAAAEMARRVGEALAQIQRGQALDGLTTARSFVTDEWRQRARALLGTLDRMVIRTIHSFCRRLLAQFPLEAGVHPNLVVDADGSLQGDIVRDILEAAIPHAYSPGGDPDLTALAASGMGPVQLEATLNGLVAANAPVEAFASDPLSADRIRDLYADLGQRLDGFRAVVAARLSGLPRASAAHQVAAAADATATLIARAAVTSDGLVALIQALAHQWTQRRLERLDRWHRARFTAQEQRALADVADAVRTSAGRLHPLLKHVTGLDPVRLGQARRAIAPLLTAAYEQMRANGIASYAALLDDAQALLHRHPEVAAMVRQATDQLLVDEFQDTDAVQCDIIRCLTLEGPVAERPGLFLVGDPKQSIYGWRNADLRAYDHFVNEVQAAGGIYDQLVVNYRSVPAILTEVTRVIEPVMQKRVGLQPSFQHLLPAITGDPSSIDDGPAVEYWISWPWNDATEMPADRTLVAEAAALEAHALARDIRRAHDEDGVPWKDIGVLFRASKDLDIYLASLREAGIPYVVEGDRNFYQRREIIEAAALVRVILDPNDQLALLTFLRSAMVGVPDAALIPLWARGLPHMATELYGEGEASVERVRALAATVAATALPHVEGIERVQGWEHNLAVAALHIARLRASFDRDPIDVFVERLRTTLFIEATEAARHLGAYRTANLERFFRELLNSLHLGGDDVQALLRRFRTSISEARAAEEERPKETADDAVSVMTIHRAKGLDFQRVYLMQLDKTSSNGARDEPEVHRCDTGFEYRLFRCATLGFSPVDLQRDAVEAAEQVRTLYVAMTRAKNRLVLAGRWSRETQPVPPEHARSQSDLLLSRAEAPPFLSALMRDLAATNTAPFADHAGARWFFPGLTTRQCSQEAMPPPAAVTLPPLDDVQRNVQILDAYRSAADRHATRALAAAASEESHALLAELLADAGRATTGDDTPTLDTAIGAPRERRIALAAGAAVHRTIERWDLDAAPDDEVERQRPPLVDYLRTIVTRDDFALALARATDLLERFLRGPCFARLVGLASGVIARELPVLLPARGSDAGPVGYVAGVVDLLYCDPHSGRLVVADYKTDRVETTAAVAERVAVYRSQGAHYTRAIREHLRLDYDPAFELWFLHPGRIELVELTASTETAQPAF